MSEATDNRKPELDGRVALRDYFAGLAMQGMMVLIEKPDGALVARHSYAVADAMLECRKKKTK